MEKERTIALGRRKHENIAQSAPKRISEKQTDRKYMSVREMGDLLGLKKTDRYWLVHKEVFEARTVAGKT